MIELHVPVVNDFGGAPVAEHDYACPVCSIRSAILFLNTGVFHPCDTCRSEGWELHQRRRGRGRIR